MLKDHRRYLYICLACVMYLAIYAEPSPSGPEGNRPSAEHNVVFQKAIAPYIAESMSKYHEAAERYKAGLPPKNRFFVSARLTDHFGHCALAVVRVTKIDDRKAEVSGRIENDIEKIVGYHQYDNISFPAAVIIDWKITHADRSEEGNVVGKYIASCGPDVDIPRLLEDQRDVDMRLVQGSLAAQKAIDQTFLRFFDDKGLEIERVHLSSPGLEEWPALARKYHGVPPSDLSTALTARATEVKATEKITVENSGVSGDTIILVSAYVVLKKGDLLFEIRQFLHFNYGDKSVLDNVTWGLRTIRPVKLKPPANSLQPAPGAIH